MSDALTAPEPFSRSGGTLGLDFANTRRHRLKPILLELLTDYGELLRFVTETDSLDADVIARLRAHADQHPAEAAEALQRAIAVREALYQIFIALDQDAAPASDDLAIFNQALAQAYTHRQLVVEEDGFTWRWSIPPVVLDLAYWPAVLDAAALLLSDRVSGIHQCEAETCAFVFLDTSRGRRRRWCDMQVCGNRAKVGRFRARHRDTDGATDG
jgi:predicted RNA-binding Zn ribbon-like protein